VLSLDPLPSLDPERPAADLFTALRSGRAAAVRERGVALLEQPLLNKDAAFTEAERDALGLRGLLPSRVMTIEEQVVLELEHVRRKPDDLEKYVGLAALHERNETLFHRVLVENLEEFLPVVYTPTVGRACQEFSHIMRRPRGVWITPDDIERIPEILRNAGLDDVRLIVATDNERILGLGDQGAGGMAIPVGKLALYSTAAGIHPAQTLAVSLDVGTDRLELLEDPLYLGYRHPRLRGTEYDRVIEAFVLAILRVFPMAVLQWEDFKQHNAIRLLDRYRHRICSFNDDIQGTGAVVLAGILAALRHVGAGLAEQRLVLLGSGAAGLGIARTIRSAMRRAGMSEDTIARAIFMLDSGGLLHDGRSGIADDKAAFVLPASILASYGIDPAGEVDLEAVIRAVRPTILIGTSGTPGAFTEAAIRALAEGAEHPIVFPLSNPTANSEAVPSDLLEWTSGRALIAAGSPFAPVDHGGVTRITGQANNVYVFPGVGLGAILAEVREVSDELFIVAAERLAALVTADRLAVGALYPPVGGLREVAREIACAIVRHARDQGLGRSIPDELIEPAVDAAMWWPDYPPLEPG
jgi:malic enzyme